MQSIAGRLAELSVPFERIPAVDGARLTPADMTSYDAEASVREMGRPLLPGEIGCFLSHRRAARAVCDTGAPLGLVLEDDALPPEETQDILAGLGRLEGAAWDAANLGRAPKRFFTPHPAIPGLGKAHYFPSTTTALAWTRAGAERFLEASERIAQPVDRFLQNWCIATNRGLAMRPAPFGTTDAPSEIEQTEKSGPRMRRSRNGLHRIAQQLKNNVRAYRNWRREAHG